jgi:D-threo-aldose 1-dehydrogenase
MSQLDALEVRQIGRNGPPVTALGLGGTSLGNMYKAVEDPAARAVVESAYGSGVRLIDTAPVYGFGLSESRIGASLSALPRDELVISTKVGYRLLPLKPGERGSDFWPGAPLLTSTFDFSREGVRDSLLGSLERLRLERVDMVAIHDPDEAAGVDPASGMPVKSRFAEVMEGAYPALEDLRRQGVIRAIGVGINQWRMLVDFARAGDFDYFLLAGRYTLLEQEPLNTLLPMCVERRISLIIGGPFNSGILATGAVAGAYHNYALASPQVLARVRQIEAICAEFSISIRAAALQFPLAHPAVASVVAGARSTQEMQQNVAALREHIPVEFWAALKHAGLLHPQCP